MAHALAGDAALVAAGCNRRLHIDLFRLCHRLRDANSDRRRAVDLHAAAHLSAGDRRQQLAVRGGDLGHFHGRGACRGGAAHADRTQERDLWWYLNTRSTGKRCRCGWCSGRWPRSRSTSQSLKFPPDGLSLRWYVALLDADQMQAAAWNSLVVAFWTTLLSVVLGTAAALGIARSRSAFARACDILFMSPLLLPALAFGFAALIFIHKLGFSPSIPFLVLGHIMVCVPFVLRTTIAALSQLDPALLDASYTLGGSRLMTFRRVTLPLIAPGLGAGAFLAFMAS